MKRVGRAEPYRQFALGSFGKANRMLIRQYNFPSEYDDNLDQHAYADSDRLGEDERVREIFLRHTGQFGQNCETWFKEAEDKKILAFLKEVMQGQQSFRWTGYRVTGTVPGNGWVIWSFELFFKHPKSKTRVYGMGNAPNIKEGRFDSQIRFGGLNSSANLTGTSRR
jgi:hypothetical protein